MRRPRPYQPAHAPGANSNVEAVIFAWRAIGKADALLATPGIAIMIVTGLLLLALSLLPPRELSLWSVARVDPEDDDIRRFIVHHYRYDPARRERRHVVVATFDNEPEFRACVERVGAEIRQRRERGERVDHREHASGVVHEPGYLRRAANGHLLSRAFKHGVARLPFEELELPSNMCVLRAERPQT